MNRVAAATKAYAHTVGLWGADSWGVLALVLLVAACVTLGAGIYILIKSGRGPFLGRGNSRRKDS
ncbi:MAG: hypothetical protein HY077_05130 [Elusimicrobia bacterium]|nr:hypothetical protein [Elusimicrobiota bacterium]